MGLGVITVVWAYDKFFKGQEPQGIHERGQWLLKIYVEATALLEKKENETPEETVRRETYDAERREMLRKWEAGDPYVHELRRFGFLSGGYDNQVDAGLFLVRIGR